MAVVALITQTHLLAHVLLVFKEHIVKMVKEYTGTYTFPYTWDIVVAGFWIKYPNPFRQVFTLFLLQIKVQ